MLFNLACGYIYRTIVLLTNLENYPGNTDNRSMVCGVHTICRFLAIALTVLITPCIVLGQSDEDRGSVSRDSTRIVYDFTFYEPDNYTDLPMYWIPFVTAPQYTIGRFDKKVGHDSPPSFYLGLNGQNVGYRYLGPRRNTQVRPDSDYEVTGWIRPDRIKNARAVLSAFYLDRDGIPIPGTQQFSRLIGTDGGSEWQEVRIHLPSGPREAQSIGLMARVMQQTTWDADIPPHRDIELINVDGGAWFDDIVIYRLPRASLSIQKPGAFFEKPDVPVIHVLVTDSDANGLDTDLTLTDATGEVIDQRPIPVQVGQFAAPQPVEYVQLPPGLYKATLSVKGGKYTLVKKERSFVVVSQPRDARLVSYPSFGIDLDGPGDYIDQISLLQGLRVGVIKIPMWGRTRDTKGFADSPGTLDPLLKGLVRARIGALGMLAGPPYPLVANAGNFPRPLLDILNDDPRGWKQYLDDIVAPNASIIQSWQIGPDGETGASIEKPLQTAVEAVRREISRLITSPDLTVPANSTVEPPQLAPITDRLALTVDPAVDYTWIFQQIKPWKDRNFNRLSVYLELPDRSLYDRIPYLETFAKRIIATYSSEVNSVYLPVLWNTREIDNDIITEPTEEYLIYRTIISFLGNVRPEKEENLVPNATVLSFINAEECVLAIWDDNAPPGGRDISLQLGSADDATDIWGNTTPLAKGSDGQHRIRITSSPIFIDDIEPWILDFLSSIKFSPSEIEFDIGTHEHQIQMKAPPGESLSGSLYLSIPDGWTASPQHFTFSISSGSVFDRTVEMRYNYSEPAGEKHIFAVIDLESNPPLHFKVPLTFTIDLKGIDVWAYSGFRGDQLIVRHGVLNQTDKTLSFRGSVAAPGRDGQYRVFSALAPGQQHTTEYYFDNARELSGRTIRVVLTEVNGDRSYNIELVVP